MRENLQKDVDGARFLVTDTEVLSASLREHIDLGNKKILDISPFDTRLSLGKSQQIKDLRVFVPIDGMQEPIRTRALKMMIEVLQTDEKIKLTLGLRAGEDKAVEALRAEMRELAASLEGVQVLVEEPENTDDDGGENFFGMVRTGEREPQISVFSYFQEMDIMSELRYTRLIVDIRDHPDQYIQIAGISAGIPQINYLNTQYIIDRKNGYMIHNIAHLKDAMLHYLDGLSNWNEALVYCVRQVEQYSGKLIVKRWKELIK
jgi:accessory secretory protein Asp1